MNRENDETWSAEEIEEWQHDEWLRVQEMGNEAYIKVEEEEERKRWSEEEKNKEKEEMEKDPCKEEQRKRWKREEEESDEQYLKEIKKIEEWYKSFGFDKAGDPRGAESPDTREAETPDKVGKCEEEGSEVSTDREERKEKGGKEEGARLDPPPQPPDSPIDIDA